MAEKPPPHPGWGKIFWLQIYPFQAISSNFGFLWQKSPPPPQDEGKFFDYRFIHFRQFPATLVFVAEKPPPLFCLFCHGLGLHHTGRIPKVPILQIHTQIPPIQISSVGYQLLNFSKYSHIQNYRTQDHGAYGRPIGSPTTIHTNIPAIAVTLLAKELWSVIRILSL